MNDDIDRLPAAIRNVMLWLYKGAQDIVAAVQEIEPLMFSFQMDADQNIAGGTVNAMHIGPLLKNTATKSLVITTMRSFMEATNGTVGALVIEAWTLNFAMNGRSKEQIQNDPELHNLSEHPDRQECVVINVFDEIRQYVAQGIINRDTNTIADLIVMQGLPDPNVNSSGIMIETPPTIQ